MKIKTDKFGRIWKLPVKELCSVCGQPDNSGDCNHKKLNKKEVLELGGIKLMEKRRNKNEIPKS